MINVAAYCRVSTDREQQLNSLENQKIFFNEYINKNKEWKLYKVYYDEGITGTSTKKRKGFNKMIQDAEEGKINLILTKEISRFARNTLDSIFYTRKLKSIGVGVIFISDNINTMENDSELRLTLMASIAQEESRKISERVKWGQKRLMERGFVFSGSILGFDICRGNININKKEAEIIKDIFNKYVYEDKTITLISKEFIEEGVCTYKRIKNWSPILIRRILNNEKYVGDLIQKKNFTPNYLEHKSIKNNGQEEKIFIKNHHEAIIDRKTWNLSQEKLNYSKKNNRNNRYSHKYWCSNKIYCGLCGEKCIIKSKNLLNGNKYRAWKCKNAVLSKNICSNSQINEKALNLCIKYFIECLNINESKIMSEIKSDYEKILNNNLFDKKSLINKINDIDLKRQKLIDLNLNKFITDKEMKKNLKICEDNKTKYIRKLEYNAKVKDDVLENLNQQLKKYINTGLFLDELFSSIVQKIVIYKNNKIEIYLNEIKKVIEFKYIVNGRGNNYSLKFLMVLFNDICTSNGSSTNK